MSKSFLAKLILDVYYFDFYGEQRVCKAGELVSITEIRSNPVSHDTQGAAVTEKPNSFIASVGELSFDITREQFRLDN